MDKKSELKGFSINIYLIIIRLKPFLGGVKDRLDLFYELINR